MDSAELPGSPEAEVQARHVLTLGDPRYGVLNGLNYLGYCPTCPVGLGGEGGLCYGPCREEETGAFETLTQDGRWRRPL
jgi:hypothetical protein